MAACRICRYNLISKTLSYTFPDGFCPQTQKWLISHPSRLSRNPETLWTSSIQSSCQFFETGSRLRVKSLGGNGMKSVATLLQHAWDSHGRAGNGVRTPLLPDISGPRATAFTSLPLCLMSKLSSASSPSWLPPLCAPPLIASPMVLTEEMLKVRLNWKIGLQIYIYGAAFLKYGILFKHLAHRQNVQHRQHGNN